MDVHYAPLEDGAGLHFAYGTQQRALPVAGDALHADPHPAQVLKVLPHLSEVLLVRKTIELRIPRIAVVIKDEAQAIAEIGAINHQVGALLRLDLEGGRPGEPAPEQPFEAGKAVPTVPGQKR